MPLCEKICLLDVGSCYNPFAAYEEFLSVGIDISPASPSVCRCDFLQLELTNSVTETSAFHQYITTLPHVVTALPRDSFHVVVFSLLLEYLPSCQQRWLCCQNAHQLLSRNGLLLVITPDSHKQHRNAAMIKSWKKAIESLGFLRWRYVKLDHIHCMAFRKLTCDEEVEPLTESPVDMLYIPQDFHEEDKDDTSNDIPHTDVDEQEVSEMFAELPSFCESD